MSDPRLDLPGEGSANFNQRIREAVQVYLGKRGDPMDMGITKRMLVAMGIAQAKPGTGGREIEPAPGVIVPPGTDGDAGDLTPPPTPTGFALDAGITHVLVTHGPPTFTQGRGYDRTVLYGVRRNEGDALPTFAQAVKLSDFVGEVYAWPSDPATTWHMWITWVTRNGVESPAPAGGVNGLAVRTGEDVQRLLDALSGQITNSELNQELSTAIDASAQGVQYLATQWGMRVQVGADGKLLVGGYGLMGSNTAERGPSIDFGVLANRFYVGAPSDGAKVSSAQPFIVQTTPVTINGVAVPAGVYMNDAFIKNGTITNAKIANAAIDDAKVASLSASKLRAGTIAVGEYIQSSGFVSGASGWRILGNGTAEFSNAVVRGTVYASAGQIGGIAISGGALYTGAYGAGSGFYLGSDGRFSLGNRLTWDGATLNINGSGTFSGALQAATGSFSGSLQAASGTFSGALLAASGTFSGTLTAQAINAVDTINIAGQAVTIPVGASGTYYAGVSLSSSVPVSCMVIGTFTQGGDRPSFGWYLHVNGVAQIIDTPIAGTLGAMSVMVQLPAGTHTFSMGTNTPTGVARCGVTVLGVKR
jgi:hypothetical protein